MATNPNTIGPYRVLGRLGAGGMGVVFRVADPHMPRELALKLMTNRDASDIAVERFWREAEALGRVQHRNVVRVHQVGQLPEGSYLLMEIVEGQPLDSAIARGALDPREAARILRELADAVEAIHTAGLLHRDIKPSNVILQPDGIPILLDFGLIRDASAERLTRTGTTLGTLLYMSPEQAGGESTSLLGPPTDIYALGLILFELITGERPFEEDSPAILIARKLHDGGPAPSSVRRDVPKGLDAICRVATARSPQDRYATAAALREDLDRFLAGRPPLALGRVRRRLGRLVALAAAALLLVAALVFLLAGRRAVDPQQLQTRAAGLAQEAADLLKQPGLLAKDLRRVEELLSRLEDVEAQSAGLRIEGLSRARSRVWALRGLAALCEGDTTRARAELERLETLGPPRPPTLALRGGLAAIGSGDPALAVRDLGRGIAGGIHAAELRGWRARALLRAGLEHSTDAALVEKDLAYLAEARGALTPAEEELRILVNIEGGRLEEAQTAVSAMGEPSAELRWRLALAQVTRSLEDPHAALRFLEGLPDPVGLLPHRRRVAQEALNLGKPLLGNLGALDEDEEQRLFAFCRVARRVLPSEETPRPYVEALLTCATRYGRYWGIGLADDLGAFLPQRGEVQRRLGFLALHLRTRNERRKMLPILRRAIAVEDEPQVRHDLQTGLCVALSQTNQEEEALSIAKHLLALAGLPRHLRADVLMAKATSLLSLGGDAEIALECANEAVTLTDNGRWTPGSMRCHRAPVLLRLGREAEAVADALSYLKNTAPITDIDLQETAAGLVWTRRSLADPAEVRAALRSMLGQIPSPKFRIRLALLQLRAGELDSAREQLAAGAAALGSKKAVEIEAVLRAIREEGVEAAMPRLEALVAELDEKLSGS